jgi:hypothetical protein
MKSSRSVSFDCTCSSIQSFFSGCIQYGSIRRFFPCWFNCQTWMVLVLVDWTNTILVIEYVVKIVLAHFQRFFLFQERNRKLTQVFLFSHWSHIASERDVGALHMQQSNIWEGGENAPQVLASSLHVSEGAHHRRGAEEAWFFNILVGCRYVLLPTWLLIWMQFLVNSVVQGVLFEIILVLWNVVPKVAAPCELQT